jgi:hypothetical protein
LPTPGQPPNSWVDKTPNYPVFGFAPEHLPILDQAAHLAGDLVSEAFQVDFTNFRLWPVDTRPLAELAPHELAKGVLAQVLCYRREGVIRSEKPDFYRICLYDPAILAASQNENIPLNTLLTYVLAHEYIHVARFVKFLALVTLPPEGRVKEELLVHAKTRELLRGRPLPELNRLMELFQKNVIALDNLDSLDHFYQ